jgi:hypothetical protein
LTEKKHACAEQLTQEQERELLEEEAYFRDRFSEVPCPPLPEGLSAENLWSRICAGEGDHQVTVDLSTVEEQVRQENSRQTVSETKTESAGTKKMGERLEFPLNERMQQNKKISLAQRRRRWAVACTLVLVVGLSTAFWKLKAPLEQSNDLLMKSSAPESAQELPESAPLPEEAPVAAAAQAEQPQENQKSAQTEAQPQVRSMDLPQQEPELEQTEQPESEAEQPALMMASPESGSGMDSAAEALRGQILQALDSGESAAEEQTPAPAAYALTPESDQVTADAPQPEEPTAETVEEAAVEEAAVEEAAVESDAPTSAQQEEQVSVFKNVMKSAKENQKRTYPLSRGQLRFDPATGAAVLLDDAGTERSSLQLAADAQLMASGKSMVEVTEDAQSGVVAVSLYQLEDLSAPQQVRSLTIQGELFDSYPSGEDSYTICTSIWFTREQVESGDFLPTVDGEMISAEQVRVISGYGEADRVNYLLSVTLSADSMTTRADLYLQ